MELNSLLIEYAKSHQNARNVLIHHICVPLITLNIIIYYRLIPSGGFPLAELACGLALVYYGYLEKKLLVPMSACLLLLLFISYVLVHYLDRILLCNTMCFFLAWLAQFIGHKIEGKKPSFINDLRFLLIGPIWVLKKWKIIA